MTRRLVVFGLSLSSSWGNGHAIPFRGLCRELAARGWQITFFERDVEWYRSNRDVTAAGLLRARPVRRTGRLLKPPCEQPTPYSSARTCQMGRASSIGWPAPAGRCSFTTSTRLSP